MVQPPRAQGAFTIRAPLWVPLSRFLLRQSHFNAVTISPKKKAVKGTLGDNSLLRRREEKIKFSGRPQEVRRKWMEREPFPRGR